MTKSLKLLLYSKERDEDEKKGWDIKMLLEVPRVGVIYADFTDRSSTLLKGFKDITDLVAHEYDLYSDFSGNPIIPIKLPENKGFQKFSERFQRGFVCNFEFMKQLKSGKILKWNLQIHYLLMDFEKANPNALYISLHNKLFVQSFYEKMTHMPKRSPITFFENPVIRIQITEHEIYSAAL